jgi:hypothetical protein
MMSHIKIKETIGAVCLCSQFHPTKDIETLIQTLSNMSIKELSTEQFCAAHLATLCEAAENEILYSRGMGKLVNYNELALSLIKDILPFHFLQ